MMYPFVCLTAVTPGPTLVRVEGGTFMKLVFFILACFVVVPVCLLLVFLGQLTVLAHPDIATLIEEEEPPI